MSSKKENFYKNISAFTTKLRDIENELSIVEQYKPELQKDLDDTVYSMIDECRNFEETSGIDENEITNIKKFFRNSIASWYDKSIMTSRSLKKPKGYPGDFETIEGVYNMKPLSEGIGLYLDIFYLNTQLAHAIINRKNYSRDKICKYIFGCDSFKALNVASGSCREWFEIAINRACNGIHLTLLDFDEDSLDYSIHRLNKTNSGILAYPLKKNVLKFAIESKTPNITEDYDFVYSIGLYDYIPDKVLRKLIQKQFSLLKGGGKMLIAFKDCTKYDKTMYDWLADWHFIPRTKEQVDTFLNEMGFKPQQINTEWEESGTIFFNEIRKE